MINARYGIFYVGAVFRRNHAAAGFESARSRVSTPNLPLRSIRTLRICLRRQVNSHAS